MNLQGSLKLIFYPRYEVLAVTLGESGSLIPNMVVDNLCSLFAVFATNKCTNSINHKILFVPS